MSHGHPRIGLSNLTFRTNCAKSPESLPANGLHKRQLSPNTRTAIYRAKCACVQVSGLLIKIEKFQIRFKSSLFESVESTRSRSQVNNHVEIIEFDVNETHFRDSLLGSYLGQLIIIILFFISNYN